MSKVVVYFLIIVTAVTISCDKKNNNEIVDHEFDSIFDYEKSIKLESSTVYEIRYVYINSNKDILITNRRRNEVFLFDSLGNLKTRLSEELDKGFPGANWAPNHAYFTANEEIFVANGAPWGIWFNRDGSFKKIMPKEYMGTPDLAFDKEDNIYSLNKNQWGLYVSKYDSTGNELFRITDLDSTNRNIMRRMIVGNNLSVIDENIYYKNISQPIVYEYSITSGELLNTYSEEPSYFIEPVEDIKSLQELGPMAMARAVHEFSSKYTYISSMYNLDEDLILLRYVMNKGEYYGYQILTKNGEFVLDYDLMTKTKIVAAKDGFVYTIKKDSVPPVIDVYKFKR